uniref:hypothetical protein n=1 Tax=Clostridium sp. NkU-1 TaxID=1095009 RepID=UPI000A4EE78E
MKEINIGRVMTGLFTAAFLCCASAFVALADVGAAGVQATIQSCLVNSDKNSVTVQADSNANMAGTDGVLYLVELQLTRTIWTAERIMRLLQHREAGLPLHFH